MTTRKNILRKFSSAFAVVLLIASIGFNVDFHYCGGELKSFSLAGKAESCHENKGVFCPIHQKIMVMGTPEKFDCCQNESVYFQSDQDLQFQIPVTAIDLQFEKSLISAILPLSFFKKTKFGKNEHPPPEPKPPPRQRKNIQVWNQSFLC